MCNQLPKTCLHVGDGATLCPLTEDRTGWNKNLAIGAIDQNPKYQCGSKAKKANETLHRKQMRCFMRKDVLHNFQNSAAIPVVVQGRIHSGE